MQEHRSSIAPGFSRPSRGPLHTVGVGTIVAQDAAGTITATRDGDPVGWQSWLEHDWWWSGPDLPGALATTGAAHHHGNALARAERHLAGDAIGPKRRRRYRRLLARGGRRWSGCTGPGCSWTTPSGR